MAAHLLRQAGRVTPRVSLRAFSTSTVVRSAEVTTKSPQENYPKLGSRDIVGYGWNGWPTYMDREEFPAPPVRFKENTTDVLALREKEKGDWKTISIEDKKALYRASFCQTFAEMKAPTGEWKNITAMVLMSLVATGWLMIWLKKFVYTELPGTMTEEWKKSQTEQMVRMGVGPIEGISSKWDYENNKWK